MQIDAVSLHRCAFNVKSSKSKRKITNSNPRLGYTCLSQHVRWRPTIIICLNIVLYSHVTDHKMGGHERVVFKPLRPKKTGTICGEEELHYIDRSSVPVGRQWACQTGELPTMDPIHVWFSVAKYYRNIIV